LDEGLLKYLNQIMSQMEHWLLDGFVQRLVVVVSGLDSGETLERWQFNVSVDEPTSSVAGASSGDENKSANASRSQKEEPNATKKSIREIHNEIQAIIRQITASVGASIYTIPIMIASDG
jgi:mitotic spindle assembly checkpoint protein MAD2